MKPELELINGRRHDDEYMKSSERPMIQAAKATGGAVISIPITMVTLFSFMWTVDYLDSIGIPAKLTIFVTFMVPLALAFASALASKRPV